MQPTISTMPVVTTLEVLLPQQYFAQIPRFSTHLVRQKLSQAFGAQVLAAAEPDSEPEGWQLGADLAWRWHRPITGRCHVLSWLIACATSAPCHIPSQGIDQMLRLV